MQNSRFLSFTSPLLPLQLYFTQLDNASFLYTIGYQPMAPMRLFFYASMTNKQEYHNDCVLARHPFTSSLKLAPQSWSVWCASCVILKYADESIQQLYSSAAVIEYFDHHLFMLPLPVFGYQAIVQGKKMVGHHTGNDLSHDLWCSSFTRVLDYLFGCCGWLLMFGVQVTCRWYVTIKGRWLTCCLFGEAGRHDSRIWMTLPYHLMRIQQLPLYNVVLSQVQGTRPSLGSFATITVFLFCI